MSNCSLGTGYVACAIAETPAAKDTLPERGLLTHRQGNSPAAMQQMGLHEQADHISTGGALLEYMEGEKLPYVLTLRQKQFLHDKRAPTTQVAGAFLACTAFWVGRGVERKVTQGATLLVA